MIIGLTDPMKEGPTLGQYVDWLKGDDPNIEIRVLSYLRENADELKACDALVLSGGNDVHPELYGRMDAWDKMKDVDERRDRFEIALINAALAARLPVLGICRGAQIFNVAMGGTLVPDLPSAGFQDHSRGKEGQKLHGYRDRPGFRASVDCRTGRGGSEHVASSGDRQAGKRACHHRQIHRRRC